LLRDVSETARIKINAMTMDFMTSFITGNMPGDEGSGKREKLRSRA
jgi:hypothetical protein